VTRLPGILTAAKGLGVGEGARMEDELGALLCTTVSDRPSLASARVEEGLLRPLSTATDPTVPTIPTVPTAPTVLAD